MIMQTSSSESDHRGQQSAPVVSVPLLAMDKNCLAFLLAVDGRMTFEGIPRKLFAGDIPDGHPNLVDRGLVANEGDDVVITPLGRATAAAMGINAGDLYRPAAREVQP